MFVYALLFWCGPWLLLHLHFASLSLLLCITTLLVSFQFFKCTRLFPAMGPSLSNTFPLHLCLVKAYSFSDLSLSIIPWWKASFPDSLALTRSHKATCCFLSEHWSQCIITFIWRLTEVCLPQRTVSSMRTETMCHFVQHCPWQCLIYNSCSIKMSSVAEWVYKCFCLTIYALSLGHFHSVPEKPKLIFTAAFHLTSLPVWNACFPSSVQWLQTCRTWLRKYLPIKWTSKTNPNLLGLGSPWLTLLSPNSTYVLLYIIEDCLFISRSCFLWEEKEAYSIYIRSWLSVWLWTWTQILALLLSSCAALRRHFPSLGLRHLICNIRVLDNWPFKLFPTLKILEALWDARWMVLLECCGVFLLKQLYWNIIYIYKLFLFKEYNLIDVLAYVYTYCEMIVKIKLINISTSA